MFEFSRCYCPKCGKEHGSNGRLGSARRCGAVSNTTAIAADVQCLDNLRDLTVHVYQNVLMRRTFHGINCWTIKLIV